MAGPYGSYHSYQAPQTRKTASPSPLRQSSVYSDVSAVTGLTGQSTAPSSNYPTWGSNVSSYVSNSRPEYGNSQAHRRGTSDLSSVLQMKPRGSENQTHQRANSSSPTKKPVYPADSLHYPANSLAHSRTKSYSEAGYGTVGSRVSFVDQAENLGSVGHQQLSLATLHRADSIRNPHSRSESLSTPNSVLFNASNVEVESLKRSSTRHFRTLSKLVGEGDKKELDFSIRSSGQEVVGLHGRRRLQRDNSVKQTTQRKAWDTTAWMDTQRQFLQAYEYLCHVGEAKEWIEGVLEKSIPEIVELEEALRDGVTLAEIVQSLCPNRTFKIFHNPKLQYRHSDNIALFFNYLAEVDLPDLFRFELIDLYEKKNIPKVIYCIHALSWLLYRKNIVNFRIGNLVGRLQFEDHELEATQKGLDKAGIALPNFSGVQAKFAVEEEPEDERIDRELSEQEMSITDFQAQVRGYATRMRLGAIVEDLWDMEDWILDLQCRIRGNSARQVHSFRSGQHKLVSKLQTAARGFIVRKRQQAQMEAIKSLSSQVVNIQSAIRASAVRTDMQTIKRETRSNESGIRSFQAAIRGALARHNVAILYDDTHSPETQCAVENLQSLIRGKLARVRHRTQAEGVKNPEVTFSLAQFQAAARGKAARDRVENILYDLEGPEALTACVNIQSAARAFLKRQEQDTIQTSLRAAKTLNAIIQLQSIIRARKQRESTERQTSKLAAEEPVIVDFQSVIRAQRERRRQQEISAELASSEEAVTVLQSFARGAILRATKEAEIEALEGCWNYIVDFQSAVRGYWVRQRTYDLLCKLQDEEESIIQFQSLIRSMNAWIPLKEQLMKLEEAEPNVVQLQTALRGLTVRKQFQRKMEYYQENMKKIIKIQSFFRAKQQGQAFKKLIHGKNPPVGTVKNFVHLLNDSDLDFEEELEFERLRKLVVQRVRQNEMAEQYINQLDIKIALLVKNKITLDEVIKHQKHFGGHVANLLANRDPVSSRDPFDLLALNKNSRRKLEQYQELFFLLQTQPQYLARLSRRMRDQGMPEKESKRLEQLVMGVFGFAQKRREEYYLLKMISRAMKEEISTCQNVQEFLRGTFFWVKIVGTYIRTPKDRKFLRDFLSPIIREDIMNVPDLDLESDPLQIYRSITNNEELRTGKRSERAIDIPREDAIRDPETRQAFIRRLEDLRDITDHFFVLFEDSLSQIPYGIRYITLQLFEILREQFPDDSVDYIMFVAGNWLWKTYIQPALTQPEQWSVIDRVMSPLQRRNLTEVAKVVGQISIGKLFGGENLYLQPMNRYVSESLERMVNIWRETISVTDVESHFEIDEYNDLYARTKPTLYIKMADIIATHQFVSTELQALAPAQDDVLREILHAIGSVKTNETELIGVSSNEVSLTLTGKFQNLEDPEAPLKAMFMETKRCVLYIIRIQSGPSLLEIMIRPVSRDDEFKWRELVKEEMEQKAKDKARQRRHTHNLSDAASVAGSVAPTALDILSLSYSELKRIALENVVALERSGKISRQNEYQDLLNSIAHDMRTKNRRRMQRTREIEGAQATMAALDEKAEWLDLQLTSYNNYIEQAMATLQSKNGSRKKKFLLPFTRQYNHIRELQRAGRVPRFGSYKYSVRKLADKGVVVSWRGYQERQWDRINITLSSDEVGVFHLEGSSGNLMIPGASAVVPLDDLLQAQFNNCQFMNIFAPESAGESVLAGAVPVNGSMPGSVGVMESGPLQLNVNLLVHLLMRKFYREE